MKDAAPSSGLIRFELFEVNLRSGELRRAGERIRLPEQSFQILAMLLEQPGEVVMREEIQKKLWPNDTVVEFENSINAAVKRLRLALEDSADEPRYVETLARRGYRWRVPVEWADASLDTPQDVIPTAVSPLRESVAPNLTGKRVSHYRVLEILGGGGMGVVYKAEDIKLGRRVALKFLPEELSHNADAKKRLEREARAASALNHPNICTVYEVEEEEGQLFIVMELLNGQTLRDLIVEHREDGQPSLPVERLLDLGLQIAEGLDTAHQQGIVHRDIKPANIFVTSRGQTKILDFGLAKLQGAGSSDPAPHAAPGTMPHAALNPPLTLTGSTMGTAGYMSPEQVRGETLDARTDLFSFGVVLYEMATGQRAFAGDAGTSLHAIQSQTPPSVRQFNPQVTPALDRVIHKALERDRESRYQSAAEMLEDLKELKETTSSTAVGISAPMKSRADRKPPLELWLRFALGLVVIGLLLGAGYYLHRRQAQRLTIQDTIVLADFANSTGDAVFDVSLKQATSIALRQSPFLNILPDRNVRATLKLMTKPANTPLTPEVAREVCQRAGSKAYIAGAVASLGGEYVIGLKAVNCLSGSTLAQEQITAERKDKVLDALSSAASRLRAALGESLATVTQFEVPLSQATTSSLEALKAYSLAYQAHREQGPPAALPHYLRAIQLDPNFAMAYLNTGISYFALVENERAGEYFTKAFQIREHASEREKLSIAGMYYYAVTGELENAAQVFQKLIDIYPRETAYYSYLGLVYARQGQYEKAVETERRIFPLAGDSVGFVAAIAKFDLALQRLDEVQQLLRDLQKRKIDGGETRTVLYGLGFVRGDSRTLAEQVEWFQSIGDESGLQLQSDAEAYSGHLGKAREMTARAVELALRHDNKEGAGLSKAHAALLEGLFGNASQARQAAAEALKIAPRSPGIEIEAALAFARVGDASRARLLSQDLGGRFPLDTQMQSVWLPTIAAQSLLSGGKPAAAIHLLQAAVPIELGYTPFNLSVISCLYSVHVRAEAYMADGQDGAAASEFQKILDHKGIVLNCPIGALAHLGLARANAQQARKERGAASDAARTRALTAYQDFFTLWKDADPYIPILKEAKAEYAKLQ